MGFAVLGFPLARAVSPVRATTGIVHVCAFLVLVDMPHRSLSCTTARLLFERISLSFLCEACRHVLPHVGGFRLDYTLHERTSARFVSSITWFGAWRTGCCKRWWG